MTINEMHQRFITLKREGQGQYHSPEEIDRFLNDASNDKYNEEKRLFEANGFISDNLSNFKKSATVTLTSGFGAKPSDYDYRTNASTTASTPVKIEIVPEGEWIERLNDPISVVSATNPICAIRDQIEVSPSTLTEMKLYYLRRPATMVFAYTEDADGNAIYTSVGSVDCDWPPSCQISIIMKALKYAGVSLPDQVMMQAEQITRTT